MSDFLMSDFFMCALRCIMYDLVQRSEIIHQTLLNQ